MSTSRATTYIRHVRALITGSFCCAAAGLLLTIALGQTPPPPPPGIIRTFAGGSADGAPAKVSTFSEPQDAVLAPDGSVVIADTYNNRIRSIDPHTGVVRTIAGSGDVGNGGNGGPATQAALNFPLGVAVASDGSVYFSDNWNDSVRRVDHATGIITVVAGKGGPADFACTSVADGRPATDAAVCDPTGVALDANDNLYIVETGVKRVRRVDRQTGIITTVPGSDAEPTFPFGIVIDQFGNVIVSDDDYRLRYFNSLDHPVTLYPSGPQPLVIAAGASAVIAGGNGVVIDGTEGDGGPATAAKLSWIKDFHRAANGDLLLGQASGVTVECSECPSGAKLQYEMLVRRIDWQTGIISTVAGNKTLGAGPEDVPATQSALSYPEAAFADADGNVVAVDRGNSRLRTISKLNGKITTSAGADLDAVIPAPQASVYKSEGVAVGPRGVYFTDPFNLRIRRVDPDGSVRTVAGSSLPCVRIGGATWPCGAESLDDRGDMVPATSTKFFLGRLGSLSVSPAGLIVVREVGIRAINDSDQPITMFPASAHPLILAPGMIATIVGGETDVPQTGSIDCRDARLQYPQGVSFAPNGDILIAEGGLCRILRIDAQSGQISVVAGLPPEHVIVSPIGYKLDVPANFADGPIDQARFLLPYSVAAAADGKAFYVADAGNNRIRKIDLTTQTVTTIAGNNVNGFAGDGGPAALATLSAPSSVRLAPDGSIFFMDYLNQRVRKIGNDGMINTVAGSGPTLLTGAFGETCGDYGPLPCGHYSGDGGPATSAQINLAIAIAVDATGDLLIADTANNRIRKVAFGVELLGVSSRKQHGDAGSFEVNLPLIGPPGVESRSGGANGQHTMVFTFGETLTSVQSATATSGTATVANSHIDPTDAHRYVVELTGVTNAQTITIKLNDVQGSSGATSSAVSASMSVLLGDTNGDGSVNSADAQQTRNRSGQLADTETFRSDVNADGTVNSADAFLVRSKSGSGLNSP